MNHRQRYRAGMAAYNAGCYAEAIQYLEPMVSHRRQARELLSRFYLGQSHYHLALGHFRHGRYGQAARHFQAAAHANPAGGGFARFLAVCHAGTGQLELAVRELDVALQADPDDVGVRIRLALAQWKQGSPVDAAATLREGLRRQPASAELHYQLGVMHAADDELADAERLFERALALDPSHVGAHERLAQCASAEHRHERALSYLQRAHELDPSNARVAWQLSLLAGSVPDQAPRPCLTSRNQPVSAPWDEEALDELGRVVTEEPDFVEAFLSLPETEVDEEVFSALAATLDRALVKHPEFADLHYHCGAVYRRLGRHRDALAHAERAVQINPCYVQALMLLARSYGQTDAWAEGVDRLEQAIRSGSDEPDLHHLMGQLCQRGGQLDRAREAYRRALALDRDHREARSALAALPLRTEGLEPIATL